MISCPTFRICQAPHCIISDIEIIPMAKINEADERLLNGDVTYRFVIDRGHANCRGGARRRRDSQPSKAVRATGFGWLGIAALIDLYWCIRLGLSALWMAGNRGFDRLSDALPIEPVPALDGWESRL